MMNTIDLTQNHLQQECFFLNSANLTPEEAVDSFIAMLKSKQKINITKWDAPRAEYPEYMLLAGDRGILAYLNIKYIESQSSFQESYLSENSKSTLGYITKSISHLDRPVFFVYIINTTNVKGVFFETNEQIKNRWLNENFNAPTYTPIFDEMGNMSNLIDIFIDLKKNNVRVS